MKTDLVGRRFGRLTAIEPVSIVKSGRRRTFWRSVCDCGEEFSAVRESILCGNVRSCGCLQKEEARERRTTHGLSKSSEYKIWVGMRDRCNNPRNPAYHNYGGRGITVCERWSSFDTFLADMGPRPSTKHSIDREENDLGYSPDNCRWVTKKTQGRNRRGLIATESTSTLKEAAEATGINYGTAYSRVRRLGWSPEEAVRIPAKVGQKVKSKIKSRGFDRTRADI